MSIPVELLPNGPEKAIIVLTREVNTLRAEVERLHQFNDANREVIERQELELERQADALKEARELLAPIAKSYLVIMEAMDNIALSKFPPDSHKEANRALDAIWTGFDAWLAENPEEKP